MSDRVLKHKGYLGSVEMSFDDNCLFGEVLFVNDLITYEGKTVEELQKSFVDAVDNYLARCQEEGLDPDKPCSGTFNVRLTPELHRAACVQATKVGVSLNELIKEAVTLMLGEEKTVINETHHHAHIQKVEIHADSNSYENQIAIWQQHVIENAPRKGH